jgi:hypothetical protein
MYHSGNNVVAHFADTNKGKSEVVPVLNWLSTAMKTYGGVDVYVFSTRALVGSEWSASRPAALAPLERAPVTNG